MRLPLQPTVIPVFYWRKSTPDSFPTCCLVYDFKGADAINHVYSLPELEYQGMAKVRVQYVHSVGYHIRIENTVVDIILLSRLLTKDAECCCVCVCDLSCLYAMHYFLSRAAFAVSIQR